MWTHRHTLSRNSTSRRDTFEGQTLGYGIRRRIADAFEEQRYVETGSPPFISTAPLHIVVAVNERLYHERYNEADKLQATGGVEITWPVPYLMGNERCFKQQRPRG